MRRAWSGYGRRLREACGFTLRQYIEALMHFGISQWERPGSWEADRFDPANYREDGVADRWF